jgi:hypothetical protein
MMWAVVMCWGWYLCHQVSPPRMFSSEQDCRTAIHLSADPDIDCERVVIASDASVRRAR